MGSNNGHAWDTKAGGVQALVPETQTPPFNLHFIMVTSAVGPKGLTPSLATKAVSSNIWGYWHWKEPLSVLGDCQLWDVSVGGGSCQPNQAAELLSLGLGVAASPGPRSLDRVTPGPSPTLLPSPLLGHRWEWEAEHIVEIRGDRPCFALGR